jgi:hypothetical protein
MTGTVVASLAAVVFFLFLMVGARAALGVHALPPRARAVLAWTVGVAFPWIVYIAVRVVDDIEVLQPLEVFFETHRRTGLLATLPAAGLGFVLFMGGILHLLLTSGQSETFTLRQMTEALRSGRWLSSRAWRRRIVITVGVCLLTLGLFGSFLVVGPPGVKLFLASCVLYGTGAALLAARRRRS